MLLANKNAVIYGGGGAIGGAVARAFAREGAKVFLAGRTQARLDVVARDIAAAGGSVDTAVVDALDEQAVEAHAEAVAARAGRIDIALNAVGIAHVQGTPLLELSLDEFTHPIHGYARTNFLTARAVARQMVKQGSGVIFTLSTPGSRLAMIGVLGFGATCAATESFTRHLAAEMGPHGVRVICLRPDAIPQALEKHSHSAQVFRKPTENAGLPTIEAMLAQHARTGTLLQRLPRLAEVADVAAFMASDQASAITGSIVNLSCGSLLDY